MVQSGGGEALVEHAQTKGLDPALVNGVMGIIRSVSQGESCPVIMWRCLRSAGGGGGGSDGADGGGGFDMGGVIKMIGGMKQSLNL